VPGAGDPHGLVFLDPPYGQNLVPRALEALAAGGWLGAAALVVAELGPGDALTLPEVFVERTHGKARLLLGRF
jgi:16S rRNA (guanine966-N2)-methyltransferase